MKKIFTLCVLIAMSLTLSSTVFAQQHQPNRIKTLHGVQPTENLYLPEGVVEEQPDVIMPIAEVAKRAKLVSTENDKLMVYAEYKYNRYNTPTEKTLYTYDALGRQTEIVRYIYNDQSQSWMYNYNWGTWICSYKWKRELTTAGYTRYYEVYNLDMTTGILRGTSKYNYEQSDINGIENFYTLYETYMWNDTINDWKPNYKETCSYVKSGNNLDEEDYTWNWDNNSKAWVKDLTTKSTYNYTFQNNRWFTLEYKSYTLVNNVFVCDYQTTYTPNFTTKLNQSNITQSLLNGQLTNTTRVTYSFNIYNRPTLTEYFQWIDNQWKLSYENLYEYTTPDSIRTQTTYCTPIYYQSYGQTTPSLCQGQTMYPYRRYITKTNPKSNLTEINYTYLWDNALCNWKPGGSKSITTFNSDGILKLAYNYCASYDTTDWLNCQNTTYTYNSKNRIKETITIIDGNPQKSKVEYIYIADTIQNRLNYYVTEDINADGIVDDYEWVNNGYTKYELKYSKIFDTDSVHITTQDYDNLNLYNLSGVKKLKVTGPISCEDLNYIAQLSQDSLKVADLSDATIFGDTLKHDCFGNVGMNTLILPKTLAVIENRAVENAYEEDENYFLTTLVTFPALQNIEKNGVQAFYLKNLTLHSKFFKNFFNFEQNIQGISDVYKTSLQSITFNDQTGKIPDAVCYNMPYLKSVTILDGVSEIGNNAFKSCGMLSSIQLPPSTLRKIGYNAFWGCNELKELTIPEGTTSIDYSAFWGCSGVTTINMPSTLTNIAQNAFWGCSTVNSMKVSAIAPPALGNNSLLGIPRSANLVVPAEGLSIYKVSPQWKEFYNMNTDVAIQKATEIIVSGSNGQLQLRNIPETCDVQVYDLAGIKLIDIAKPDRNTTINLSKGAYLVKIGTMRVKTIIQ